MTVLAECPECKRKQSENNDTCCNSKCGVDLKQAKESGRVRYWIDNLINGKPKRQLVGKSIKKARAADAKRKVQKAEGKEDEILEIQAESKMTFNELSKWWLNQDSIRARSDCWRLEIGLNRFKEDFGNRKVKEVKLSELKNYQTRRLADGAAYRTVDAETHDAAKAMMRAAWQDGMIRARTWRTWERFKKLLSGKNRRSNRRERVLEVEEYCRLISHLPKHLLPLIQVAMHTGARKGELVPEHNGGNPTLGLTWDRVDFKAGLVRLDGKTGKRDIPINDQLREIFKCLPRPLKDPHKYQVFTYRGKPIRDIRRGLRKACEGAGITYGAKADGGFVFRDLRRTAKTLMARAAVDKSYRDALLGHEPQDMDSHYMKPSLEDLSNAIRKYGDWLEVEIASAKKSLDKSLDQTTS